MMVWKGLVKVQNRRTRRLMATREWLEEWHSHGCVLEENSRACRSLETRLMVVGNAFLGWQSSDIPVAEVVRLLCGFDFLHVV